MFTMEELLSKRNQNDAMGHFANKPDSRGADGMRLSELKNYWQLNGNRILEEIRTGTYEPAIMEKYEVIGGSGKKRVITNMAVKDRFIARLISQKLKRYMEPMFLPNSFAYQDNKGILEAVMKAQLYVEAGNEILLEIDIKDYFDTIPLDKMLEELMTHITDNRVVEIIKKYMFCRIEMDNSIIHNTQGLVQGNSFSPILSNLYLHSLDMWLEEQGLNWIRFADNIYIYANNMPAAESLYKSVAEKIEQEYDLKINSGKSGIYNIFERRILGYEFYKRKGSVEVRKHKYQKTETHGGWYASSLQMVNKEYHIVQDGVLNKKDYALLFENSEEKHHIPVEVLEQINIYNQVAISTNVLNTFANKNIRCGVFDKHGNVMGYFTPYGCSGVASTMLKQCELYLDSQRRLETAKKMEIAMLHNMRANLRYYHKKNSNPSIKKIISEISGDIEALNIEKTVDALLLIEARARQRYYMAFNYIINNPDFAFEKRSRRPPKDPINALISFGNTLLYNQFLQMLGKTTLEPGIGVVHATNRRRNTLNLDFADIYKPVIVDRVIFTLINLHQIKTEDFELHGDGVYMTRHGKKMFLEQFEEKLSSSITINGKRVTYKKLMQEEVANFYKHVVNGEKYRPYKYY